MAKNNKMPAIRFSGYTDTWEQRKLSEVVAINPKTELPDEFKYVDLESVVGTNLLGFQVIKKENAPSRAQRLASYGDVFYQTVRPYQRNNYLFENVDKDMVFSTGYAQLRSRLDSYFLLTLVQNDNFVKVVLDNCTGTSYPAINGSELGKITVQIPPNEVEANQIGKIFRRIDKSITLHQRKLEKLKLTKKALLQKLFPQDGSKFPELRFQGFADAWEQRKLNDFVTIRRGLTYKPSDIAENGIRVLRSSNIDEDQFIKSNDDVFVNLAAVNIPFAKNGDILITSANGSNRLVGKHTIINDVAENSAVPGGFMLLAESNNPLFTDALLSSNWYKRFINTYVAGGNGAIGNLSKSDLESQSVMVPSEHEQTKIGQWYDNINQLIILYQRKLEMLKNVKKGLLQKMFV